MKVKEGEAGNELYSRENYLTFCMCNQMVTSEIRK